jgi:hypothetical protein
MRRVALLFALVLVACTSAPPAIDAATTDANATDAAVADSAPSVDVGTDAAITCEVSGVPGTCIDTTACAAMAGYQSTPGHCPGAANIQCCSLTPDVSSNPPIPTGYRLMMQSEVTTAMTDWAVAILHDPSTYPMFATTTMTFTAAAGGSVNVLARVEWHPPDFQNMTVHRGVTLYVPL